MSTTIVVLGATGDLTCRLLAPALVGLEGRGRLTETTIGPESGATSQTPPMG